MRCLYYKSGSLIETEEQLTKVINTEGLEGYKKLPFFSKGSFFTCIDWREEKGLISGNEYSCAEGAGYKKGLTFKCDAIHAHFRGFILFGAMGRHGVYAEHVRLATPDEVEQLRNKIKRIENEKLVS